MLEEINTNMLEVMMLKRFMVWLLIAALSLPSMADYTVAITGNGECSIKRNGETVGQVNPGFYKPMWTLGHFTENFGEERRDGIAEGYGTTVTGEKNISMTMTYKHVGKNALSLAYRFVPKKDMMLQTFHSTLSLENSLIAGRRAVADGKNIAIPKEYSDGATIHLFSGRAKFMDIDMALGTIRVMMDNGSHMLLQDNRRWNRNIGLRIGEHRDKGVMFKAGEPVEVNFTLVFPEPLTVERNLPVTLTAGKDWIPLKESLDIAKGSALDFSSVVRQDAPAGKYGYTRAVGQNFEFEGLPGVPQRFYGVNFCLSAHNITPEQSEILATRLCRIGYNAVRYHHYEKYICNTKIKGDSTQLDPVKMAMFDAMFAAMKRHGLYATTDLFVSRPIYANEVWPGSKPELLPSIQIFKRLCAINERAMENWKTFTRNLLTHVNPYTGLSYAKDPALSLIALINEGTLDGFGMTNNTNDPRMLADWLRCWNRFLDKKYGSAEARNKAWNAKEPQPAVITDLSSKECSPVAKRDFHQFLTELEINMINTMKDFLRNELGCKALITDMNCGGKTAWAELARNSMDYVDDHFYVDHPRFLVNKWQLPSTCNNTSIVKDGMPGGASCMFTRLLDKPYTITEWNYSAPGRYRGIGGILTGCLASIQNWSGLWRFAYSHSNKMFEPGTIGYFNMVNDPLNVASERAIICLYLRGDLPEAKHTIASVMTPGHFDDDRNMISLRTVPAWLRLGMLSKLGMMVRPAGAPVDADVSVSFSADAPKAPIALSDYREALSEETGYALFDIMKKQKWITGDNVTDLKRKLIQSAGNQLLINAEADTMVLNTERTAGCFAQAGQTVDTDAIRISIHETEATVWVSSLDGKPIRNSNRLLLTHLTDMQNSNQRYNEKERRTVLAWGKLPHLVRNGQADVLLKVNAPDKAKVYALDVAGNRIGRIPAKATPQGLAFRLEIDGGADGARILYEVTAD